MELWLYLFTRKLLFLEMICFCCGNIQPLSLFWCGWDPSCNHHIGIICSIFTKWCWFWKATPLVLPIPITSQLNPTKKLSVFFSHIGICHGTQINKIQLSWDQFNYCAPQESCLFCAHCHIPPGDFETVARQDGPVFGLTSQSSTGGSHRLDRGGCLPDRWSSGFRNYGASEELWSLSSTTCWYFFTWLPHLPISHNHAKSAVVESFF